VVTVPLAAEYAGAAWAWPRIIGTPAQHARRLSAVTGMIVEVDAVQSVVVAQKNSDTSPSLPEPRWSEAATPPPSVHSRALSSGHEHLCRGRPFLRFDLFSSTSNSAPVAHAFLRGVLFIQHYFPMSTEHWRIAVHARVFHTPRPSFEIAE
jgi:hypothetical protein